MAAADRLKVPMEGALVRDSAEADLVSIQRIYSHYVLHGLATFEEVPPTVEEMQQRRQNVLSLGLPYLVAELGGAIVGYCYASSYRPRPAYRFTIENSVYVAADCHGQGIGRLLMSALLDRVRQGPWRQVVAIIGDCENAASIGLHRSLGFKMVGTLDSVGFKFNRWVDTVIMQLNL